MNIHILIPHVSIKRIVGTVDIWLCRKLPYPICLWWKRLWIRKDEFHPSLDFDVRYLIRLDQEKRILYYSDLVTRRGDAHQREIE